MITSDTLSTAQRTTLKAFILADPALAALATGENIDVGAIAAALNATVSPNWWVYRPSLSRHELLTQSSQDGTTAHMQGTVTATGGGGDMTVDNTSFAAGQAFTVTGFTLTDGNA